MIYTAAIIALVVAVLAAILFPILAGYRRAREYDEGPAPLSHADMQAEWAAYRPRQRRSVGARRHARRFHNIMVVRYGRRAAYLRGKVFLAMLGRDS